MMKFSLSSSYSNLDKIGGGSALEQNRLLGLWCMNS